MAAILVLNFPVFSTKGRAAKEEDDVDDAEKGRAEGHDQFSQGFLGLRSLC
jgi:hypothetical protein